MATPAFPVSDTLRRANGGVCSTWQLVRARWRQFRGLFAFDGGGTSARGHRVSAHGGAVQLPTVLACPTCLGALGCLSNRLTCSACGTEYPRIGRVYSFARPEAPGQTAATQAAIYDGKADAGELLAPESAPRLGEYPDLLLTYREHARQVRRMGVSSGSRVLDLGCSTGTFLRSLRREVIVETHGVDVSLRSLARAAELYPAGYWYHSSADRLPFRDGSFDSVFAFDALEHVTPCENALREIARVLRPGGRALIHVPVADIERSFDALWRRYRPDRYHAEQIEAGHFPQNMRSKSGLIHACETAGLHVERAARFNVLLQNMFDYRSRHRILARLFNGRRLRFGFYHGLVAPIVELFTVVPDRLIAALSDAGASVYILARREDRTP